jgi:hypothetical protein
MGWEPRRGGSFYYGKERRGKQVVSIYYGKGPLAALAESQIARGRLEAELERDRRAELQALWLQIQGYHDRVEKSVQRLYDSVEAAFYSAMIAAGFHRHNRQWRRRRGSRMNSESVVVGSGSATKLEPARRLFDRIDGTRIERFRGDMSREVENLLLKAWSRNPIQRERIRRDVAERRGELAGENPTIIEIMLADRVAICWLEVQVADRESRTGIAIEILEVAGNDYYQRRADRAQRRLFAAVRALGQVRKLALPRLLGIVHRELLL